MNGATAQRVEALSGSLERPLEGSLIAPLAAPEVLGKAVLLLKQVPELGAQTWQVDAGCSSYMIEIIRYMMTYDIY